MLPDMLETISRRSKHLHQFIAQYANFARLPEPKKEWVLMADFIDSIKHICAVQIISNISSEKIEFDPVQVEQVLINLVKNAKESGSEIKDITLTADEANKILSFTVADRGQGMTESQLQQALLPFFTTKPEGTGVGLALCNEIAIAHGGKLRLANRDNGGLSVIFSLSA